MPLGFSTALGFTLKEEGGFQAIDTPTNMGITQLTYDKWNKDHGVPPRAVQGITNPEVHRIYKEWFWEPCSCQALPYPLGVVVFDSAVNSGQKRAILWLQRALHLGEDGIIGPEVLGKVKTTDPYIIAYAAITCRRYFIATGGLSDRWKRVIFGRCERLWQHIEDSKEE